MRKLIYLFATIVCLLHSRTMNLDDIKKAALESNFDVIAAKYSLERSAENSSASYYDLFPAASLYGSYKYYVPEIPVGYDAVQEYGMSYGIQASQTLYAGGRKFNTLKISRYQEDIQKMNLSQTRISVIKNVELKYLSVLENIERLNTAKISLELSVKNEENAKIKFDAGTISNTELLQFLASKENSTIAVFQAQNLLDISYLDLKNYLNSEENIEPEKISIELYGSMIEKISAFTNEDIEKRMTVAVEFAVNSNITLKTNDKYLNIYEKNIDISKSQLHPSVSLSYALDYSKSNLSDFSDQGIVSLNASVPILPVKNSIDRIDASKIDYKIQANAAANQKNMIIMNLKRNLLNLFASARQIMSSRISKEYSGQIYSQSSDRYKAGVINSTELLNAEIAYKNASNVYTESFYSFLRSKSTLLELLGTENYNDLEKIIE